MTYRRARTRWSWLGAVAVGLSTLGLAACEGGVSGPEDGARTSVTLTGSEGGSAALAAGILATETAMSPVDLDAVSSIVVRVDRVQVHRAGDDADETDGNGDGDGGEGEPAWIDLSVEAQDVDLISDLSGGQTLTLAEGELPAGEYDQVRLFLEGATITFSEPQPVPGAGDGEITDAALSIPSVARTGIKIPGAGFTVEEDDPTTVEILFEAGTSVQNIVITGTGDVKMTPVLVGSGGGSSD